MYVSELYEDLAWLGMDAWENFSMEKETAGCFYDYTSK